MRDFRNFDWFHDLPTLTDVELGVFLATAFTYVQGHAKVCNPHCTHSHDYTEYICEKIAAEILSRNLNV